MPDAECCRQQHELKTVLFNDCIGASRCRVGLASISAKVADPVVLWMESIDVLLQTIATTTQHCRHFRWLSAMSSAKELAGMEVFGCDRCQPFCESVVREIPIAKQRSKRELPE